MFTKPSWRRSVRRSVVFARIPRILRTCTCGNTLSILETSRQENSVLSSSGKENSDEGRIYALSFVLHFTVNMYLTRTDPKYSTRHTLNSCEEIPRASRFMCGNFPRGFYRCRGAARNSRGFRMNFAWILREF